MSSNGIEVEGQPRRGGDVGAAPAAGAVGAHSSARVGRTERAQLEAWVAWANATLMQLVVAWFRTGGQRNSKWLGRLVGNRGGIACADTANMATRFAPWCRAILHPGEENDPLH